MSIESLQEVTKTSEGPEFSFPLPSRSFQADVEVAPSAVLLQVLLGAGVQHTWITSSSVTPAFLGTDQTEQGVSGAQVGLLQLPGQRGLTDQGQPLSRCPPPPKPPRYLLGDCFLAQRFFTASFQPRFLKAKNIFLPLINSLNRHNRHRESFTSASWFRHLPSLEESPRADPESPPEQGKSLCGS